MGFHPGINFTRSKVWGRVGTGRVGRRVGTGRVGVGIGRVGLLHTRTEQLNSCLRVVYFWEHFVQESLYVAPSEIPTHVS